MKTLLTLLTVVILTGCIPTITDNQLHTDCGVSNEVLFDQLTEALTRQTFIIKVRNANYLEAESLPYTSESGSVDKKSWIFIAGGNHITAEAKVFWTPTTKETFELYYDDTKAPKDYVWYWSVRNTLEKACGNKVIFAKKKGN